MPCIMPETPYCSDCKYGLAIQLDDMEYGWECMYDGKEETEGEPN